MPELPEVETSRRGIDPYVRGQRITQAIVRQPQLRWPVSPQITGLVPGQLITHTSRRGKYLMLHLADDAAVIIHLGMSGSLRIVSIHDAPRKHDHIDLQLSSGHVL